MAFYANLGVGGGGGGQKWGLAPWWATIMLFLYVRQIKLFYPS